ncbi:hypothetical protein [Thauera sp. 27]|uniref:hypothetical protein n=1 Tax=Thauera sp. 27 TaxID=305700 RepID=UPI0002CF4FC4|nr:hypothetical protein [Thauera sp. 27]ENO75319.1 hypothetical protein B447_20054 [Thauera sp. 27]
MIAPSFVRIDMRRIDALMTLGRLERLGPAFRAMVRARLARLPKLFDDDIVTAVGRACTMSAMMRG